MPIDLDFRRIRPLNGSRNTGFEELCCQLARLSYASAAGSFVRKEGAGGDAGVECYWQLNDGSEVAWQAKYFFELGDAQWRQLDDSVRTALLKHSALKRYVICLPINLTDQRIGKRLSQRQRWRRHVAKWSGWACDQRRSILFQLWDASEIRSRLCRDDPSYSGRALYWFDERCLTTQWLQERFRTARESLGERYTPESHVDLPIAEHFDWLVRAPAVGEHLLRSQASILRWLSSAMLSLKALESRSSEAMARADSVEQTVLALTRRLSPIPGSPAHVLPSSEWIMTIDGALEACSSAVDHLRRSERPESTDRDKWEDALYCLRRLSGELRAARDLLGCPLAEAEATRGILVTGAAGVGKSHLLADVAEHFLAEGWPVLLLLGQDMTDGQIWPQLLQQLHWTQSGAMELLGALDAAAEACGVRALLLVDALNENQGQLIWRNRIAAFVEEIRSFPRLAVGLTCRTSYEDLLIPPQAAQGLVRIEHRGFAGHELKAAQAYLDRRGIERPNVRLLAPEFSNPLFLKTCCEALLSRGETAFPKGLAGVTALFDFYVESVSRALNHRMSLDPLQHIVRAALRTLAAEMAKSLADFIQRERAVELFETIHPSGGRQQSSLLFNLVSEGVLTIEAHGPIDESQEVVRFTYDRFADHFVANHVLRLIPDVAALTTALQSGGNLFHLLTENPWRLGGLIEALSIQIPERFGLELLDLLEPDFAEDWIFREALVESVVWREPRAVTTSTVETLERLQPHLNVASFYDLLLRVAMEPDHILNAEFLHQSLSRQTMVERDAEWSTSYVAAAAADEESPLWTLIYWAWDADTRNLDRDKAELCAVSLAWILTTSSRISRDRATKALASLLRGRAQLACDLLQRFNEINEPYLIERLYAAVYGAALHTDSADELRQLARRTYDLVFDDNSPYPHVLWRDYARGIIEVAVHRNALPPGVDLDQVRPPYRSSWPIETIPVSEVESYASGYGGIHNSLLGFPGDFGNYTMGCVTKWSESPLGQEPRPIADVVESYISGLSDERARKAVELVIRSRELEQAQLRGALERAGSSAGGASDPEQKALARRDEALSASVADLSESEREEFRTDVERNLWSLGMQGEGRLATFDSTWARRWVCKRAHSLGWTEERFGEFDRHGRRYDRHDHTIERVGKKYQWIAFHELIARMADNLNFLGDSGSPRIAHFEGPWQCSLRDIDPSLLIRNTGDEPWEGSAPPVWWRPFAVQFSDAPLGDQQEWLWSYRDLPPVADLIEVVRPVDSSAWFVLYGFSNWRDRSPSPPERRPWRDIWYRLSSLVVKRDELPRAIADLCAWPSLLSPSDFEPSSYLGDCFVGEFDWHPSYGGGVRDHWREPGGDPRISTDTVVPVARLVSERGGYDYSIDDTVRVIVPGGWLMQELDLRMLDARNLEYCDARGSPVFLDPSIRESGPSAGLVRAANMRSLLEEQDLAVVWIVAGEKGLYGGEEDRFFGRLTHESIAWFEEAEMNGLRRLRTEAASAQVEASLRTDWIPLRTGSEPEAAAGRGGRGRGLSARRRNSASRSGGESAGRVRTKRGKGRRRRASPNRRCPIPGCSKVFRGGRQGLGSHVGSLARHPRWHPRVKSRERRLQLFRAEFSAWLE